MLSCFYMRVNSIGKFKIAFLTSLTLIMFFGVLYLVRVWNTSKEMTSDKALLTAKIAESVFPKDSIAKLDLNSTDLEKKEYQHIKTSLLNIRKLDEKIRFSYIYVERKGEIYIVADSEPVDSKDYSPPGQKYTEASVENLKPFVSKQALITKPITDRWGTWISILVPMKSYKSDEVIAVFGMDYPAKDWNDEAIVRVTQAGIIILALILIMLAFYVVIDSNLKIRESERNYHTFFETIEDAVIVADKNGKIFYTNKATSHKLGYSEEELRNMHVLDVKQKSKRKEAEKIFADVLAGKQNSCPLPLEKKDGTLIPSDTRIWFGKWDGKDCFFCISKDISKDQELLQKFSKIFANNPTLMAMSTFHDKDRIYTDVNKSFLDKFGYEKNEVIGKSVEDLGIIVEKEKQKIIINELKQNGHVQDVELTMKTKSGVILEGSLSGEMIDIQGKPYALTVLVDQTESNQSKKEMEAKNEELERMNKLMINRELKMVELKKEVEKLKKS